MATNKSRYTVSVDKDMFQKIEDFRFELRFQTRSEATVEFLKKKKEEGGIASLFLCINFFLNYFLKVW